MANKPLKSIKFPGLSDTYTVPEVDDTLAVTGAAADAKKVGDEINDLKADLSDRNVSYKVGKNIFDKGSMLQPNGKIISNTGKLTPVSSGRYALIPVEEDTQYVIVTGGSTYAASSVGALVYSSSDNTFTKLDSVDMSSLPNGENNVGKVFTTPTGTKAVCVNVVYNYNYTDTLQIEEGDAFTGYEPYSKEVYLYNGFGIEDTFARDTLNEFNISTIPKTNYYDKNTMTLYNKFCNQNALQTANGWDAAAVPVEANTKYAISGLARYNASSIGYLHFANGDGSLISSQDMSLLEKDTTGVGRVFTTPNNCAIIRFCVTQNGATSSFMDTAQVERGDTCTNRDDYELVASRIGGKPIYDVDAHEKLNSIMSNSIDKNVVLLGDSITFASNGWVSYMRRYLKFKSLHNFAQSGATWKCHPNTVYDVTNSYSDSNPNNNIWNEYNKLVVAVENESVPVPDVILILAGTNDQMLWGASYYGSIAEAFNTSRNIVEEEANQIVTTCDAIRYNVSLIKNKWKNCQVIITTPIQRGLSDQTPVFTLQDLIKECAKNLGTVCIDQTSESGVYGWIEAREHRFLADGVHPSTSGDTNGAEMVGRYLAKRIYQSISN